MQILIYMAVYVTVDINALFFSDCLLKDVQVVIRLFIYLVLCTYEMGIYPV